MVQSGALAHPIAPMGATAGPCRLVVADTSHLAAITSLYRDHMATGPGCAEDPLPDAAEMARRLDASHAAELPRLVALDEAGAVLGFSYARPFRERAGYRHTVENSIYVARAAQRRGIARLLLGALIDSCIAAGCRQMVAVVGDSRNVASIRLHESMGFEVCGYLRAVGSRAGEWLDLVMLQRALVGSGPVGHA